MNCYCLENELIKLSILPDLGAKIASLVYKPQNFEVLFQPEDGGYRLAAYGDGFADYDTSGADEMFPTIDPCAYPYEGYQGKALPDHGELWSIPWSIIPLDEGLAAEVKGRALPYIFRRTISLSKNTVHMEYQVCNRGDKPLYGLWAFHGLAACDESTRLILPPTQRIITVHDSKLLGSTGTSHSFPLTLDQNGQEYFLDRIKPRTTGKTEKIYVEGLIRKGEAALTLNEGRLIYKLVFPEDKVPYLGVWLNEGGFKGEYNCALEPSSGYYDSLEVAQKLDGISPLAAGATREWYLEIKLESC